MAFPVVLTPLTLEGQSAFTSALILDCVDYLLSLGEETDPIAARQRAQVEIEPEVEAAAQAGDLFWSAVNVEGTTVGWLWVKQAQEGLPPAAAFLYQILVREDFRRQGYGTAMLAALEETLASSGWRELRLNAWDSNEAARRLYEKAGYEMVERFPAKRQLCKRLRPANYPG